VPSTSYDAILIVTLLMYLDDRQRRALVRRLWPSLNHGGRLLCIEPAVEMVLAANRLTGRRRLAGPTSGVHQFTREELTALLAAHPGARLIARRSLQLLPGLSLTSLHHCVAVARHRV
jgi:hypothetical protein